MGQPLPSFDELPEPGGNNGGNNGGRNGWNASRRRGLPGFLKFLIFALILGAIVIILLVTALRG